MESCKSQLTSQDSEWRFQWDFNLLIHISVDIKQDSFSFRTKFGSNISISPKNNQQKFWKFFRLATLTNWPLDKPVAGRLTLQTITTHKHSSVPQINLIFFCTRRTSSLRRKLSIYFLQLHIAQQRTSNIPLENMKSEPQHAPGLPGLWSPTCGRR